MIIIDKSPEKKSAPYIWQDPEVSKMTKKQEIAWREEEIRRWREGYNGITPSHYFALSQGFIKLPSGKTVRPWWRDWDAALHEQYEADRKKYNSLYVFKRRRYALTTYFVGFEPLRIALTDKGSVCGFTSCDVPRGNTAYREKLMVAFSNFDAQWNYTNLDAKDLKELEKDNGLPDWEVFRTAPGTRDGTKLRIQFMKKEKVGTLEKFRETTDISEITYAQTSRKEADAAAFEGFTMNYLFVDEFFLHPYANRVYASAEASLSDGFVRTGMFITGGSCGEMSHQGIANARRVIKDSTDGSKESVFFIPGYACVDKAPEFDEFGNETGKIVSFMHGNSGNHYIGSRKIHQPAYSDEKKARDYILSTREKLSKSSDPTKYRQFMKAYPLTLDELLEASGDSLLSDDIMEYARRQKKAILNQKEKHFLEYKFKQIDGQLKIVPI